MLLIRYIYIHIHYKYAKLMLPLNKSMNTTVLAKIIIHWHTLAISSLCDRSITCILVCVFSCDKAVHTGMYCCIDAPML